MTRPRILVVDSDQAHAEACAEWLGHEGFEVERAPRFEDAVRALRTLRPAVVIVDAMIDGGESSILLRDAVRREMVVYSMSDVLVGPINRRYAVEELGALEHWEKPLLAGELVPHLKSTLGDAFPAAVVDDPAASVEPSGAEAAEGTASDTSPRLEPEADTVEAATQAEQPSDVDTESASLHDEGPMPAEPTHITRATGADAEETAEREVHEEGAAASDATLVTTPPTVRMKVPTEAHAGAEGASDEAEAAPLSRLPRGFAVEEAADEGAVDAVSFAWAAAGVDAPASLRWPSKGSEGRLEHTALAAVLCAAARSADEVTVEVEVRGAEIVITVVDGLVLDARDRGASDPLLRLLLEDQLLRTDQAEAIERNLPKGRRLSSADAVSAGVIGEEDLPALHDARVRRALGRAMLAERGAWRVRPGVAPLEHGERARVPLLGAAWEASRELLAPERLERGLGECDAKRPYWAGERPTRSQFPASRAQRALLASIDGETTVSDLRSGAGDDVSRVLYALLAAGRVSF